MMPEKSNRKGLITVVIAMAMLILTVMGATAVIGDFIQGDPTSDRVYEWGQYGRDITGSNNLISAISAFGGGVTNVFTSATLSMQKEPLVGDFDLDFSPEIIVCADGYLNVLNYTLFPIDQYALEGCEYGQPSIIKADWSEFGNRHYIAVHNNTNFMIFAYNDSQLHLIYNLNLALIEQANLYGSGLTCWNNDNSLLDGCIAKVFHYETNKVYDSLIDEPETDGVAENLLGFAGNLGTQSFQSSWLLKPNISVDSAKIELTIFGQIGTPETQNLIYNVSICQTAVTTLSTNASKDADCGSPSVDIASNINLSEIIGAVSSGDEKTILFQMPYSLVAGNNYIISFDYVSSIIDGANAFWNMQGDCNPTSIQYQRSFNTTPSAFSCLGNMRLNDYGDEIGTNVSERDSAGYFLFTKVETNDDISDPLGTNATIVLQDKFNHSFVDISTASWNETFSVEDWDSDNNMEFVAVTETDADIQTTELGVFDIFLGSEEQTFQISRSVGGGGDDYCEYNRDKSEMNPMFHQFSGGDFEIIKLCPTDPPATRDVEPPLWAWNSAGNVLSGYPVAIGENFTGVPDHQCGGHANVICSRAGYGLARNFDNGKIVVSYRVTEHSTVGNPRIGLNEQGVVEVDEVGNLDYVVGPCRPSGVTGNPADSSEMVHDWCYGKNTWNQLTMARADFNAQSDYIVGDLIFSNNETLPYNLTSDPNSTNPFIYDAKTIPVDLDGDNKADYMRYGDSFSGTPAVQVGLTGTLNLVPTLTDIIPDTCYPVCIGALVQYQVSADDTEGNDLFAAITCNQSDFDDFTVGDFVYLGSAPASAVIGDCTYNTVGNQITTLLLTDSAHIAGRGDDIIVSWSVMTQIGNCYNTGESDAFCAVGIDDVGNVSGYDEYGFNDTTDEGATLTSEYFDWNQCQWTGLLDMFEPICPVVIMIKQGAIGIFGWMFTPVGFAILLVLIMVSLIFGIVLTRKDR